MARVNKLPIVGNSPNLVNLVTIIALVDIDQFSSKNRDFLESLF
jgi:hypothetical protein